MRRLSLVGVAGFVAGWYAVYHLGLINPVFIETPHVVGMSVVDMLYQGAIFDDIALTLARVLSGFLFASAVGIPLGIIMGYSKTIYGMLQPLVDFLRSVPATALFPLFILFFGIGDFSKIAVVVFGCGLIILINSMYGIHHATKSRMDYARTLGLSGLVLFRKVAVYEALPHAFVGMRQAISISLILVVVTEMFVGTNAGLGQLIMNFQLSYKISEMMAVIAVTGLLGYVLNKIFLRVEEKMIHWVGK